jgi:alpha-beta hydrolase superfamily lysophospholipase
MPLALARFFNRRRMRRWLIFAVLLLVVWLGTSLAVAQRLTRRRRPPFPEPIPTAARGTFSAHRFPTRDGEQIGAWFVAGREDQPSVLLLHGNGGSRRNCLGRAALLAEEGYAVLLISLRAHGDSTGNLNDIGYGARHDVVAAVEFLERKRPGKPVIIQGVSMGAAAAVFASRELARRVSGYILESPYQDLRVAVWNRVEHNLPPVLDRIAYEGLALVTPIVLPDVDKISPLTAIGGIPDDVPVLIFAGGGDPLARPAEARALYRRVEGHGKLIIFDRAGHHDLFDTDPGLYRRTVLDFNRAIKRRPP